MPLAVVAIQTRRCVTPASGLANTKATPVSVWSVNNVHDVMFAITKVRLKTLAVELVGAILLPPINWQAVLLPNPLVAVMSPAELMLMGKLRFEPSP